MTLASSLAALKSSLDQGNEQFTNKHFRLIIEALEAIAMGDLQPGNLNTIGLLDLAPPTELTIADGAITITQSFHTIDTEGDAASDDVTQILGATSSGHILILRPQDTTRTVVMRDGVGLSLAGDFTMDSQLDTIVLVSNSSNSWLELCRSDNST